MADYVQFFAEILKRDVDYSSDHPMLVVEDCGAGIQIRNVQTAFHGLRPARHFRLRLGKPGEGKVHEGDLTVPSLDCRLVYARVGLEPKEEIYKGIESWLDDNPDTHTEIEVKSNRLEIRHKGGVTVIRGTRRENWSDYRTLDVILCADKELLSDGRVLLGDFSVPASDGEAREFVQRTFRYAATIATAVALEG